jgi:hypothetical protein
MTRRALRRSRRPPRRWALACLHSRCLRAKGLKRIYERQHCLTRKLVAAEVETKRHTRFRCQATLALTDGKAQLAIGHFLGQMENKLAIAFFSLAQQAAQLVEITAILAGAAPSDVVGRLPLQELGQFWRIFALVEELIEWAFECASQLFQRFDGGDSMTIFYAGYITTKQSRTLFDVALGEFLFLAHFA